VFYFAPVRHKQNDVVVGLDNCVVMRNNDLFTAHERYDVRPTRQTYVFDLSADHAGFLGGSVPLHLESTAELKSWRWPAFGGKK